MLARWKRLDGHDVFFLTGTDEHGQKVEKAAAEEGIDPQVFADKVAARFPRPGGPDGRLQRRFHPHHRAAAQGGLRGAVAAAGGRRARFISAITRAGTPCATRPSMPKTSCRPVRTAREVAPSGAPVEWVREPSYFFRLSEWQDRLLRFHEEHPDFIAPTARRNEVLSFVAAGSTTSRSAATSFRWGIPVPGDPGHVIYVWLDALANYITAVGYPDESERWPYWPADVHFVGKEIVRFHAVYWPAFLMAAGIEPPKRVFAHGWWTVEGEKMRSRSAMSIEPRELIVQFGLDPVRYFLLREVPFGNDGDFGRARADRPRTMASWRTTLGNLAKRTLSLIQRNCDGQAAGAGTGPEDDASCSLRRAPCPPVARTAGPAGIPCGAGGDLEGDPRRQRLHHGAGALGAEEDRSRPDAGRPSSSG